MKRPPFCPIAGCRYHVEPDSTEARKLTRLRWFTREGSYRSNLCGEVRRFRCRHCGSGFSEQTFALDYYAKRRIGYRDIEQSVCTCRGVRATARALGCSPDSIVNRCSRLARQSIAAHALVLADHRLGEELAADGIESFAVSQYWPADIHLLVGARSQFVYFADYVTRRRKGRMTAAQRRLRAAFDLLDRPAPGAVQASFRRLLGCALSLAAGGETVVLHTDEKRDYARAIAAARRDGEPAHPAQLIHRCTSSRAARSGTNPLFAVNYLDRELRKDLAEHVRETVRFARNPNHCMERLWVYLLHHNFTKRYRINDSRRLSRTHAAEAGIAAGMLRSSCRGISRWRRFRSFAPLSASQETVWCRRYRTPLRHVPGRLRVQLKREAARGEIDLDRLAARISAARLERPQYLPAYAYS